MTDEHKPPTDEALELARKLVSVIRKSSPFPAWATGHTDEEIDDQLTQRFAAVLDEHLIAEVQLLPRTLTLPNGTVVRAGDVLVFDELLAAKVTAVGEETFLGQVVWYKHGEWGTQESAWANCWDWKPWSEVYPDRPVPGGDPRRFSDEQWDAHKKRMPEFCAGCEWHRPDGKAKCECPDSNQWAACILSSEEHGPADRPVPGGE